MNKGNNIDVPTPSDDPKKVMIEDYKKHIRKKELQDEKYKWELVDKYKGKPNLDEKDFQKEMKPIDYDNLVYNMAKPVLNRLVTEKTEETRQLFSVLFDESKDLTERVKLFNKETLKIYKEIGGEHGHHQDERSISAYLTFRYPEKYTFYKDTY